MLGNEPEPNQAISSVSFLFGVNQLWVTLCGTHSKRSPVFSTVFLCLCVTFPLSLLVLQIIRVSITALEAITISSHKDLLHLKRRPPWTSRSCPPQGHQALPWGPWTTPCPDITPPVRLSASLTSCRTPQETHPVPNPTCPGPCTPCLRKSLVPALLFLRYPSTVVLTMAITCHIHQK